MKIHIPKVPIRFVVVILASLSCFFCYVCRFNLSMAIVRMVPPSNASSTSNVSTIEETQEIHHRSDVSESAEKSEGEKFSSDNTGRVFIKWEPEQQSYILGSFFGGYVIGQVPGARCAEIWGAKWLFFFAGLGSGLVSLIFPWCVQNGVFIVLLVRFIMGISQSALFPAAYCLINDWLPRKERSKWLAVPAAFSRVGGIVLYRFCSTLIDRYDWQTIFYLSAIPTLTWTVIWFIVGTSRPKDNFFISQSELMRIEADLEVRTELKDMNMQLGMKKILKRPIDWSKLTRSRDVWLLTLVMLSSEWSNTLTLTLLAQFLDDIFLQDITDGLTLELAHQKSGEWISNLLILFFFVYQISGYLSAKMIENKFLNLSTLQVRKLFETIGHALQATGCLMLVFFTNRKLVGASLILIIVGRSSGGGGQCQLPNDLSKDYFGTIFAFCNTIANLAGFFGPSLFTQMLKGNWTHLWIFSSVMFVVIGLLFLVLGDNRCQDFSKKPQMPLTATSQLSLSKNIELSLKLGHPHSSDHESKIEDSTKIIKFDIPTKTEIPTISHSISKSSESKF